MRVHPPTSEDEPRSPPPLPPFTEERAIETVRLAEDGWNSRDPARVARACTVDTRWRNRAEFVRRREEAQAFRTRKWNRELDYRLIKELWAFTGNRRPGRAGCAAPRSTPRAGAGASTCARRGLCPWPWRRPRVTADACPRSVGRP